MKKRSQTLFYIMLCTCILLIIYGCHKDKSCPTCPIPIDTTSHNFTWQTFILGDSSNSSTFYDVALITDTLVYAVGEIYQNDTMFNAAKWDGKSWTLIRISITYNGNLIIPSLEGVIAFSPTDIWVVGSFPIHGDGNSWTLYQLQDMGLSVSVSKAWGINSTNMYFVGRSGSIVHYNGINWTKLESGTTTFIDDIYGVWNKRTNQYEAYCAVTDFFQPNDKKILRITNKNTVDSIQWNTGFDVVSVWSATGAFLYACGGRVFDNYTGVWKETRLGYYTNCIRGSEINNVFVVGDLGLVAHFNGSTWQNFFPAQNIGSYNRLVVTNNVMITVGVTKNGRAIAIIGKRY